MLMMLRRPLRSDDPMERIDEIAIRVCHLVDKIDPEAPKALGFSRGEAVATSALHLALKFSPLATKRHWNVDAESRFTHKADVRRPLFSTHIRTMEILMEPKRCPRSPLYQRHAKVHPSTSLATFASSAQVTRIHNGLPCTISRARRLSAK